MYAPDQQTIEQYAAHGPDETYRVLQFVQATINQRFALVPRIMRDMDTIGQCKLLTARQQTALAFLKEGRHMVYHTIQERRHDPVVLMEYLTTLPGYGMAKAGFAAQLLIGEVGCIDVHNLRMYPGFTRNSIRIDGSPAKVYERLIAYVAQCAQIGTAALWDNWCARLASLYKPGSVFYPWQTAEQVSKFHVTCILPA